MKVLLSKRYPQWFVILIFLVIACRGQEFPSTPQTFNSSNSNSLPPLPPTLPSLPPSPPSLSSESPSPSTPPESQIMPSNWTIRTLEYLASNNSHYILWYEIVEDKHVSTSEYNQFVEFQVELFNSIENVNIATENLSIITQNLSADEVAITTQLDIVLDECHRWYDVASEYIEGLYQDMEYYEVHLFGVEVQISYERCYENADILSDEIIK